MTLIPKTDNGELVKADFGALASGDFRILLTKVGGRFALYGRTTSATPSGTVDNKDARVIRVLKSDTIEGMVVIEFVWL